MEKRYSTDNEDFSYTDIGDAVWDASCHTTEDLITVYEGDMIPHKLGDFADSYPLDTLCNNVYDECDDLSDGYLDDITNDEDDDLKEMIKDAINTWADKYGHHPTFYHVGNVKEIRVELIDDGSDYRILESAECI